MIWMIVPHTRARLRFLIAQGPTIVLNLKSADGLSHATGADSSYCRAEPQTY